MSQTNNYELVVIFFPNECIISVYNSTNLISTKRTALNGTSEEEYMQIIVKEPEIQQSYKSVRLIAESSNYTFIPSVLFEKEEAPDYLNLQLPTKENTICVNYFDNNDFVCVFAVPIELKNALSRFYPDLTIEHPLSYIISAFAQNNKGNGLYIWMREGSFDAIVLKNSNLEFSNSFKANNKEDFLYFVMNLLEQLNIGTDDCKIEIFNAIKHNEFVTLLAKYIPNTSIS